MSSWKERAEAELAQFAIQEDARRQALEAEELLVKNREWDEAYEKVGWIVRALEEIGIEQSMQEINDEVWAGRGKVVVEDTSGRPTYKRVSKKISLQASVPSAHEIWEKIMGQVWGRHESQKTSVMSGEKVGPVEVHYGWSDEQIGSRLTGLKTKEDLHALFIKYSVSFGSRIDITLEGGDSKHSIAKPPDHLSATQTLHKYGDPRDKSFDAPGLIGTRWISVPYLPVPEFTPEWARSFVDYVLLSSTAARAKYSLGEMYDSYEARSRIIASRIGTVNMFTDVNTTGPESGPGLREILFSK